METPPPCQYLDWDSEFFGCRIARITVNRLNAHDMDRIRAWCQAQAVDCVYFWAAADDAETVSIAEANQFHLVDIRMTFQKQLEPDSVLTVASRDDAMRLSTPADVPFLKAIARASHRDSRFYYDSHFPRDRCDALYETWIEKSCHGYADAVVVAEYQGHPVGYVSCHLLEAGIGRFGLVGVRADIQGRGLGTRMVNAAIQWFIEHHTQQVIAVTQRRNIKGQRLYRTSGFLSHSTQLVYHHWFA